MSFFNSVVDFNTQFGVLEPGTQFEPKVNIFNEDPKTVDFCLKLIREEVYELSDAVNNRDFVEIHDATADIVYVTWGMAARCGIDGTKLYTEKPSVETDMNNYSNYNSGKYDIHITNCNKCINDQFKLLEIAVVEKKFDDMLHCLVHLVEDCVLLSNLCRVNFTDLFNHVHENNMSKLCKTEEEAQRSVDFYKQNLQLYDTPAYRLAVNGINYVVYNESTKKILKSIDYKPVDLKMLCGYVSD